MHVLVVPLIAALTAQSADAASRLKSICESLADEPNITYAVRLPLGDFFRERDSARPDDFADGVQVVHVTRSGSIMYVRYEQGKPIEVTWDSVRLYLIPDGSRIGAIQEKNWRRIEGEREQRWPWSALIPAIEERSLPHARLRALAEAIGPTESKRRGNTETLTAWLGGFSVDRMRALRSGELEETGPFDVLLAARMDPAGPISLELHRDRYDPASGNDRDTDFDTIRFEPSAIGSTRVDVSKAVVEIARVR